VLNRRRYGERGQRGLLIAGYKRLQQATRGSKKDADRAITPAGEAARVPTHLALPGFPQAKQLCYLHAQPSLGTAATGSVYACRVALVVSNFLQPCRLWPSRLLCQGEGFSGKEY